MQKFFFILLNLIISSNLSTWIVLSWYQFFNIEESIDIMAYTGLIYIVFSVFYIILKIQLFSILKKYFKIFPYSSAILEKLETNKTFRNKFLISIFLIDLFFLIITFFIYKILGWGTEALLFIYLFNGGGVLICYLSYLVDPWIKSRFNEE